MKVLHVCHTDGMEGAGIGAYGLHRAMLEKGVNSQMLVVRKTTDDDTVLMVNKYIRKLLPKLNLISKYILKLQNTPNSLIHSLNIFPTGTHKKINRLNPDVVQLHWVNDNTLSIREISRIKNPIVWKMPDMWPFSGSEHYTLINERKRYQEGYKTTNRQQGSSGIDIDRWVWLYKKWAWKQSNFTIVGTSEWIAECARKSMLFKDLNIRVISNPINLSKFSPVDRKSARQRLGLNQDSILILFGSLHVERDVRKGFDKILILMEVLKHKYHREKLNFLVFGTDTRPKVLFDKYDVDYDYPFPTKFLGRMEHDDSLSHAYSAADVYITPSLLEGFGLTAAESLACGTPVVCFDISGLKDIVDHKVNGYRASCYDIFDLKNGIEWVLKQDAAKLREHARTKAENSFSYETAVSKYLRLYQETIS